MLRRRRPKQSPGDGGRLPGAEGRRIWSDVLRRPRAAIGRPRQQREGPHVSDLTGERRSRSRATAAVASLLALIALAATAPVTAAWQHHHRSSRHGHGVASWYGGQGGFSITSQPWGTVEGHAVNLYTLTNGSGMKVSITNYGGIVQAIDVPNRRGKLADVALGFPISPATSNDEYPRPPAAPGRRTSARSSAATPTASPTGSSR